MIVADPLLRPVSGFVYWCWLNEGQGLVRRLLGEERFEIGDAVLDVVLIDCVGVRI